jgi:hypothetical protein
MNATPIQPDSDDRTELARLLPGPVERDLPSDRHRRLQEFVMSEIHQDLRAAEPARRPAPRRRLVVLTSALAAVAAAAVAVATIGTGGSGSPGGGPVAGSGSVTPAGSTLSGQQILLAAATTAERSPEGSGTYWYVKVLPRSKDSGPSAAEETWTRRDGRRWFRGAKTGGTIVELSMPIPFRLAGSDLDFAQFQKLPTSPDALTA